MVKIRKSMILDSSEREKRSNRMREYNLNKKNYSHVWNKGLIGVQPCSEETKEKMRIKRVGRKPNQGHRHSQETKRKMSEQHKLDKHYNWQGGISFLPYCKDFNEIRKEKVRERDGRICQECGKSEIENGVKLTCHHIDYNKKNSFEENLIALCRSCNSKANKNRNYWEEHFMEKLKLKMEI